MWVVVRPYTQGDGTQYRGGEWHMQDVSRYNTPLRRKMACLDIFYDGDQISQMSGGGSSEYASVWRDHKDNRR